MHLRAARCAARGRQHAAVPHRDPADLPAPGLFRDLHGRPALKGYYSSGWHLHQSLVDAASGRNCSCRKGRASCCRRSAATISAGLLQHAAPATVFATPTVNGYRRFRAEFAGARPRRLGLRPSRRHAARARRHRRSGDAAREPRRRARRQSVSLHRRRRSSPASTASTQTLDPGRATTSPMPPTGRCLPTEPRLRRSSALEDEPLFRRELGDDVHRLLPQAQAHRGGPLSQQLLERSAACCRTATSRPNGNRTSISISSDRRRQCRAKEDPHDCWNNAATARASKPLRSTTGTNWCRKIASTG